MIAFSCPHCGVQLQVKENKAGKTKPCPGCSRGIRVPASAVASTSTSAARSGKKSIAQAAHQQTVARSGPTEDTASPVPEPGSPPDFPFLAPPQGSDEVGRLGPYVIRKVLGTGAMGIVFLAEDPRLNRMVALKVMKPSLAAHADFHRRFLREAQLAAAIEHVHIVTIYQVGEDRGVPFLAMRLLQGETLEDRLASRKNGRLKISEAMRVGREIAEGLAAAHSRGLVHRDIKPANIWLEAGRDRVKIVDFGLARGSGADAHFTQAGAVIGTPSYMAPEQANAEEVDGRCDLFSLGAVMYRLCTGELPFAGKDTLAVLTALATKTPTPPHHINMRVPQALGALIMRLLAKDRKDRPQSGGEVVTAIEAIERAEAAKAAPAPPPQEAPPEKKRPKKKSAFKKQGTRAEDAEKRKRPKKKRPHGARRKKRRQSENGTGRLIMIVSLVLLGIAVLVLVIALLVRVTKGRRAAVTPDHPLVQVSAAAPGKTPSALSPYLPCG
jgi:serine/threonine protein kinase